MRTGTWIFLAVMLSASTIGSASANQFQSRPNELQSADTETALKAIAGLGESGDIRAVPLLLDALRDERTPVRQYAVEALQRLVWTLDTAHFVVKRWLQSLINKLQHGATDDVITVERPRSHASVARLCKAV